MSSYEQIHFLIHSISKSLVIAPASQKLQSRYETNQLWICDLYKLQCIDHVHHQQQQHRNNILVYILCIMSLSVSLSLCLSVSLCVSVCLSVCLSVSLSVYLSLSIYLSVSQGYHIKNPFNPLSPNIALTQKPVN